MKFKLTKFIEHKSITESTDNHNVTKYLFTDTQSMIDLAKDIQSRVYWGGYFWIGDEDDNDTEIQWKYLWDYIESAYYEDNAKGIIIEDNKVSFF